MDKIFHGTSIKIRTFGKSLVAVSYSHIDLESPQCSLSENVIIRGWENKKKLSTSNLCIRITYFGRK